MKIDRKVTATAIGLALAVLVSAPVAIAPVSVHAQETATEFLDDAKDRLQKGEVQAAVIQLRNAIARDPELQEAKQILAELYLRSGNPDQALELAEELYAADDNDQNQILLARSLLTERDRGSFEENLERIPSFLTEEGETPELSSIKLQLLGDVQLAQTDVDAAERFYQRALEANPRAPRAYLQLARVEAQRGDLNGALEQVYSALDVDPSNLEAWLFRSDLLSEANRPGDAMDALNQANDIQPNNPLVMTRMARLALRTGDIEEARSYIDTALQAAPENVDARYTNITILVQEGRFEEANRAYTAIEDLIRNFEPALILGGIIKLNVGEYASAEQLLARYVSGQPGNIAAQHLLADTFIRREDPRSAIEVLEPLLSRAPDDIGTMRRLASAHTRLGNIEEAARYFEMIQQQPVAVASRQAQQRLALIGNALGVSADEVTAGAAGEGDPVAQTILLVQDYIESGQLTEAVSVLQERIAEEPDNVILETMLGEVRLQQQDYDAAKEVFSDVLSKNGDFLPAVQGLTRAYAQTDGLEAAERVLYESMDRAPENDVIVLGTAQFLASREDIDGPAEAAALLEDKIQQIPTSARLKSTLAQLYLQQGQQEDAARVARALAEQGKRQSEAPARIAMIDLAGRVLVDAGAAEEGIVLLDEVAKARPDDVDPLITLARAYFLAEKREQGRDILTLAQSLAPDNRPIVIGLVDLAMEAGERAEAEATAARFAERDPVGGALAQARIHSIAGEPEQAIAAVEEAQAELQSQELALTLFNLYRENDQGAEAAESLGQWVVANPDDGNAKRVLSSFLLTEGDLDQAADLYERIIEADPNDPISLNNLAWIRGEQGDLDAGIRHARRALQILPNSPEIADTLGWLLVRNGQYVEGIRLVRAATQARPQNRDMQYHLAYGLYMTGDRDEARSVLVTALEGEEPFERRGEAEDLLEQLGR